MEIPEKTYNRKPMTKPGSQIGLNQMRLMEHKVIKTEYEYNQVHIPVIPVHVFR